MTIKRNLVLAAVGLALACGAASGASAEARWDRHHPRREEVNDRLQHQDQRIHHARHEGELTGWQAHRLHVSDRRIRLQERFYAHRHHGHLTRGEQARLNHEENRVSRHIHD